MSDNERFRKWRDDIHEESDGQDDWSVSFFYEQPRTGGAHAVLGNLSGATINTFGCGEVYISNGSGALRFVAEALLAHANLLDARKRASKPSPPLPLDDVSPVAQ